MKLSVKSLAFAIILPASASVFASTGTITNPSPSGAMTITWSTDLTDTYVTTFPKGIGAHFDEHSITQGAGSFEAIVTSNNVTTSLFLSFATFPATPVRLTDWSLTADLKIVRLSDAYTIYSQHVTRTGSKSPDLFLDGRAVGISNLGAYKVTGSYSFQPGTYCTTLSCTTVQADDARVFFSVTGSVPEPSAYALLTVGLLGVAFAARRSPGRTV